MPVNQYSWKLSESWADLKTALVEEEEKKSDEEDKKKKKKATKEK